MLFAIAKDPLKKTNLAEKHPEVVARLASQLIEFRKLQPKNAVDVYGQKKAGFKPPKAWKIPGR